MVRIVRQGKDIARYWDLSSNALNPAIPSATSQSEREPVTDLSTSL
jgi:hypothetical protein